MLAANPVRALKQAALVPAVSLRSSNSGAPLVASLHNSDLPFSSQPVFLLTDDHLCYSLTQSNSQPFPPQHWVHYLLQLVHGCSCFPVNHSVEFVNPTTGVHTQHIESYWNRVKKRLKSMKAVSHFASHLEKCPTNVSGCRSSLLSSLADISPSANPIHALPSLDVVYELQCPTNRYIPHKARPAFARVLSDVLKSICYENSEEAWLRLFMLPKCVLRASRRGGRHCKHPSIEQLCSQWSQGDSGIIWNRINKRPVIPPQKQNSQVDISKKKVSSAMGLSREGVTRESLPGPCVTRCCAQIPQRFGICSGRSILEVPILPCPSLRVLLSITCCHMALTFCQFSIPSPKSTPAAFDLTVTSPLNPITLTEAGVRCGSSALFAEARKHNANDSKCAELGWVCIPLAVESYGCWGTEAQQSFSRLAARLAIQMGCRKSQATTIVYQRLSFRS
eukprot:Em0005g920a